METNQNAVDLSSWQTVDESPVTPGPALASLRSSLGFKRSDLAKALGKRNISKFCNRLTAYERGRTRPDLDACAELDRAMGLEIGHVHGLWAETDRMHRAHHTVRSLVLNREMSLLRNHHTHLVRHQIKILAKPEWANARVTCARLSLMWAGGGCFTIGELITGWSNGTLLHNTATGHPARIASAHGSVLSGLRGVTVLDAKADSLKPLPNALQIRSAMKHPRPDPSPLNFGDVLASTGVSVPDIVIRHPTGEPIARYRHGERIVFSLDGKPLIAASDLNVPTPEGRSSPVSIGNRPIPTQVGPLQGAWVNDRWRWGEYFYQHGRIYTRSQTVLWLDGEPPPGLVGRLVETLA